MKKRFMSILLILCMILTMIPATALAAGTMTPLPARTLYKVNYRNPNDNEELTAPNMWSNWNAPYRLSPVGDIQGEIPWGTVLEVTATDGMWLKVKYAGLDCYIYHDKATKVSEPDMVCSPWAKERLSYYNGYIGTHDEWPNTENDWTKPITRADMVEMLFLVFNNGEPPYKDDLPFYKEVQFTDIKNNEMINGKNIGAAAYFLADMGVIPGDGKFNASANVTYGEFSDSIIKLSAYMDKYYYSGNLGVLTQADIRKFAIGGDTRPSAKITKEQARIMCESYNSWFWDTYDMKVEDAHGASLMGLGGTFVINVNLGKYPRQPYLVIGADGKGELSNSRMQNFKVTHKKTVPSFDPINATHTVDTGTSMKLFTIQTEDGKYLAMDGAPKNGSRLTTQDKEFLWWIDTNIEGGYAAGKTVNIMVPGFYSQRLKASGRSSKDGTHIITWYQENRFYGSTTEKDYPYNTEFMFHMVHGANSNTPTVPTKYLHGLNLQSYPAKTTYSVGEGFDRAGFKMMYQDDNNGGKITDVTADYKFVTTDGVVLTQGYKFTTSGTKIVEIVGKDANPKTLYTNVWDRSLIEGKFFITVTEGSAPVASPVGTTTADPSKTSFVMNDKPVSLSAAYNINGTNYLQLRGIAVMLNNTSAQFDVGWDGQHAVIEPGKAYSGTATETKLQNTTNVRNSTTKFKLNGEVFTFTDARLIDGDTNYLQLREFAQKLTGTSSQFNVYWDSAAGKAVIQLGVAYTGTAQ